MSTSTRSRSVAPSGPGVKGARCKSPSCYPRGRRYSLDFARVYDHVARLLDENAFPHAVVGALGLHAYGHSRATFDLDLVTVQAAQPSLVKALEARLRDPARLGGVLEPPARGPRLGRARRDLRRRRDRGTPLPALLAHAQAGGAKTRPCRGQSTSRP